MRNTPQFRSKPPKGRFADVLAGGNGALVRASVGNEIPLVFSRVRAPAKGGV